MVSEWDDSRPEIALSFLPRQEEGRRYLRIFPRFFHAGNNPIGILRHELGHILGLRHEHLRSQTQCISASKQENAFNASWVPVSEYDPESIMHYDCTAPVFGREEFSSGDCKLIQALYGDDVIDVDKEALLQQIDNVQSFKEVWETCKQGIAELKAAGLLQ